MTLVSPPAAARGLTPPSAAAAVFIFLLGGCGVVVPRPNTPSEFRAEVREAFAQPVTASCQPPLTSRTTTTTYTGPENETRSASLEWTPASFTAGSAKAAEFEAWDVQGLPFAGWIIAGSVFLILGGVALYLGQRSIAIAAAVVGGVLMVLPIVTGVVKVIVAVAALLAALGAAGYAAWRLGWLDKATGPTAQAKLLSEGDAAGAAAAAYAYAGGAAKGKIAASKIAPTATNQ